MPPADKSPQGKSDERSDRAITVLISQKRRCCFLLIEEAVRGDKPPRRSNDYLYRGLRLDVKKPVCTGAEGAQYDRLGKGGPIVGNLKHRAVYFSGAPSNIDEQQKATPQQPAAGRE